jgi:precorrin-6B methylase 2
MDKQQEAFAWQTGVWDRISDVYQREIDVRFAPVVEGCISRAGLRAGQSVLDLGTGTGAVAVRAAAAVGPEGRVTAVDLSSEMLELARRRVEAAQLTNVEIRKGRAEEIPAPDAAFDVIIASLSLMYAIDRERAAEECARVLRGGGRLVAAVWAGADMADIVRFQQTAGAFAPAPPVAGVGPGALADPEPFLVQLRSAGVSVSVESDVVEFTFENFEQAWDVLAGVTTANLDADRRRAAKTAVQVAMWPEPTSPRLFNNRTQFVVGVRK